MTATVPSLRRLGRPAELARNPASFLVVGYAAYRLGGEPALVELAVVAAAGAVVLAVAWRWPLAALAALATYLPFLQLTQAWLWRNGYLSEPRAVQAGYVKELVLAVVAVRALQLRPRRPLRTAEHVALAWLGLVALYLVLPVGPSLEGRFVAARADAGFLLVFLVARWLPVPGTLVRRLEGAFIGVGAVVALVGVWNRWGPDGFADWIEGTGLVAFRRDVLDAPAFAPVLRIEFGGGEVIRSGSIFLSANELGYFLLVVVGLVLGRLLRGTAHRVEIGVALVSALGIVYTNSRSALLLLPVVALVCAAASGRLTRGAGVVLAAGAVVAGLVAGLGLGYQVTSAFDTGNDRTAGHVDATGEALGRLVTHPLGSGLGTASSTAERLGVEDSVRATENFYLRVGAQIGIVGSFLALATVWLVWRSVWGLARRDRADPSSGVVGGFAAVALGAFALDTFSELATAWWLFLLAGVALQRADRSSPPARSHGVAGAT